MEPEVGDYYKVIKAFSIYQKKYEIGTVVRITGINDGIIVFGDVQIHNTTSEWFQKLTDDELIVMDILE